MPENTQELRDGRNIKQPVCIHTRQITDSCLDKDCIEELRVFLSTQSQAALDAATTAKVRCAELIYTNVDVQPLAYKGGHYAVDLIFYYRIIGDAILGGLRPSTITGLAVFSKRVVLFGGKLRAKIFSSADALPTVDSLLQGDAPVAVVEALDPMVLAAKVREVCECRRSETELTDIPPAVAESFGEQLVLSGEAKRLYVTVGQFSTVRLERDAQLSVPACDYCAPVRECCDEECCEEDPCELFSRIDFPMGAFFPEGQGTPPTPSGCKSCGSGE